MKFRAGFVSNSSSSSFIINLPDGDKDWFYSEEGIKENLIKEDAPYFVARDLVKHIMWNNETSFRDFSDLENYECRELIEDFKYDDDFLEEITPIIQKYYERKNKNKLEFTVNSYEKNLEDFEWNPEKYLKLPFVVERMY